MDNSRLNWLRAGVLGANDGIVSVAAVIIGVAGATSNVSTILLGGLAALIGGAISMALGEYVSVSSQLDSQRQAGVSRREWVSPWHAAFASIVTFLIGGVLPLAVALLLPGSLRIPLTAITVLLLLGIAGGLGAHLGGARLLRPTLRVMVGGALALTATYLIGSALGAYGV